MKNEQPLFKSNLSTEGKKEKTVIKAISGPVKKGSIKVITREEAEVHNMYHRINEVFCFLAYHYYPGYDDITRTNLLNDLVKCRDFLTNKGWSDRERKSKFEILV